MLRWIAGVVLGFCLVSCSPTGKIAVYPEATTVRLYVADWIAATTAGEKGRTEWRAYGLTDAQASRVWRALITIPPPSAEAACFVPHHFFRFYDSIGRQVGELKVCFCCEHVQGTPMLQVASGQALSADYTALKAVVRELGASVDVDCDVPVE
jgi:hypothetical protein